MICSMTSSGLEIPPVQKAFQRASIWLWIVPVSMVDQWGRKLAVTQYMGHRPRTGLEYPWDERPEFARTGSTAMPCRFSRGPIQFMRALSSAGGPIEAVAGCHRLHWMRVKMGEGMTELQSLLTALWGYPFEWNRKSAARHARELPCTDSSGTNTASPSW